jgi:transposase
MSTPRTAAESGYVRQLAVSMMLDGEPPGEVAASLDVGERSVWRWLAGWRSRGDASFVARPKSGRPPKLSPFQTQQVLAWIDRSPTDFDFATDRWTAPRLATVIRRSFGVQMNPRYLNRWLRRRGITPQMPEPRPRERNQALIDAWLAHRWPRLKKRFWN